jgi:S-formylglutathione hydrolase FrmB
MNPKPKKGAKMKKILIGLFLASLILSLFISCGKRENPLQTSYPYHEIWQMTKVFPSLGGNVFVEPDAKNIFVYLPSIYDRDKHRPQLMRQGFSVLYLLHDFGGDYSTYEGVYKIGQIADQLIAEGQIQPMIIVMPDASSLNLIGSFYTNTYLIGQYEDYIVNELMDTIDANFHTYGVVAEGQFTPDGRYRAIGGLGMGGYGALKLAMDYDTLFSSVSASSPIAAFESFLTRETIDKVFKEDSIPDDDFSFARYHSLKPAPDSLHPDKTYTQLIFAMAAAFSPADHAANDPDTLNFFTLKLLGGRKYGVNLPFDSTRTIKPDSIWTKWLLNDVKTKLTTDHTGFGDLGIYLDCGDHDEFNLCEGTKAFEQLLSAYGKEHTYMEYSGYPGYPAGHDNFIYDRLVEILKFHSRHFPPPAWRDHP